MRKKSLEGYLYSKKFAFKQILRTMKITTFFLLVSTFSAFSMDGYSQSAKVHLESSEMKVEQLISTIEAQTNYLFVYNKKNVDLNRNVKINTGDKAVSDILKEAFAGTSTSYVMEGKNIVLRKEAIARDDAQQQQNIAVKGIVTDMQNEPIIGANILQQGTTNGTITDIEGQFILDVPVNAQLVISYIGYKKIVVPVNGKNSLSIKMEDDALKLDNVVVTAMGIKKKEASLTYSTQQLNGNELTRAKDANMINALTGKSAGVQINRTANLGGSAKVSIRGARSAFASGNNQPLYVIDGVPMLQGGTESTSTVMGGDNDGVNRDA
ncbi:MAG: carboxypeptidase-like regulatory domain-containing protein, partial [Bacteroides sp.]